VSVPDICSGCERLLTESELETGLGMCGLCSLEPGDFDAWSASLNGERSTGHRDQKSQSPAATVKLEDLGVETRSNGGCGMRLVRIGDVTPRRVTWLEEGLIPYAMLTGLVAPGGTVKGLYGIHLAVKLAQEGKRTLFLCSEDALEYIVRPRFMAAGCDAQLAFALDFQKADGARRNLRFPSDMPALLEAVAEIEPDAIDIDPFASHLDPGFKMSSNNQVREALEPLNVLAQDSGAAIIPVYHTGKDRSRGALESVAFEDACRCVLKAAKDDEDEDVRHVEVTKSNIGPTGYGRKFRIVEVPLEIEGEKVKVAKLVDEGRSNKSVEALLVRKTTPGPEPEKRDQARSALVDLLVAAAGRSINAKETKRKVADQVSVSEQTVWRAFDALRKEDLAGANPSRDEHGSILEWGWFAKAPLLVGRGGA
jgi:hypothetical protein